MGQILIADANPGVAAWSLTGEFLLGNGAGSTAVDVVLGLPATYIGRVTLFSFTSAPTGIASIKGAIVSDGSGGAKLQVISYNGTGVATNAGANITVAYAIISA